MTLFLSQTPPTSLYQPHLNFSPIPPFFHHLPFFLHLTWAPPSFSNPRQPSSPSPRATSLSSHPYTFPSLLPSHLVTLILKEKQRIIKFLISSLSWTDFQNHWRSRNWWTIWREGKNCLYNKASWSLEGEWFLSEENKYKEKSALNVGGSGVEEEQKKQRKEENSVTPHGAVPCPKQEKCWELR